MLTNMFALPALKADIRATRDAGSYSVQVVDYQWEAGFAADYRPDTCLLHGRLFPPRTNMVGALGDLADFRALGQLILLPAYVTSRTASTMLAGSSHNIVCSFDEYWLTERGASFSLDPLSLGRYLDINGSHIQFYLRRLEKEVSNPGSRSAAIVKAVFELMILDLLEVMRMQTRPARLQTKGGRLSPPELRRIVDLIDHDPVAPMLDLAKEAGCTLGHLSRSFRVTTGMALSRYIAAARMAKARDLILRNHPIKQVAFETGFASVSAFSKAYYRVTGERPSRSTAH